jgi:hypothetical protein
MTKPRDELSSIAIPRIQPRSNNEAWQRIASLVALMAYDLIKPYAADDIAQDKPYTIEDLLNDHPQLQVTRQPRDWTTAGRPIPWVCGPELYIRFPKVAMKKELQDIGPQVIDWIMVADYGKDLRHVHEAIIKADLT